MVHTECFPEPAKGISVQIDRRRGRKATPITKRFCGEAASHPSLAVALPRPANLASFISPLNPSKTLRPSLQSDQHRCKQPSTPHFHGLVIIIKNFRSAFYPLGRSGSDHGDRPVPLWRVSALSSKPSLYRPRTKNLHAMILRTSNALIPRGLIRLLYINMRTTRNRFN